ncbi:N-acetyltransferase [Lactobacillus gasseri]|nr:N-acetyltransferase [Lactobacillus gasseri]
MERGDKMQKITYYNSPVGQILLASDEQGLTGLWLHSDRFYADNLAKNHQLGKNKYLDDAIRWLDIYFARKDPNFLPKLHLIGTTFQKQGVGSKLIEFSLSKMKRPVYLEVLTDNPAKELYLHKGFKFCKH